MTLNDHLFAWSSFQLFVLQVVTNILSKGTTLREYTKGVENNLRQVELDSIQVGD